LLERFTQQARQVVVFAKEEARGLRHSQIGTEHLLLGLLREEGGLAARTLQALDITLERARAEVARLVPPGDEGTQDHTSEIPLTPRTRKVLERSLRESLSLGHQYIGTEHILLALVRENDGVAIRILLGLDADSEKIRDELLGILPDWRPHAARMDKDKRVSATCPICHEGELSRMDGPPEWYVLPAATLGLPDDDEKRIGRGMPVGISVCSRCEYVALFLPPTVDEPGDSGAP